MSRHLRPIAEQVVVITGASSGIGLETARRMAAAGARVVLVARDEQVLADTVRAIEAAGGTAAYAVADVGVPEQVEAAARTAIDRYGRIDTWINNAGVAIYAKLTETPFGEHQRMFQTNYFGVVNGAAAALPHLKASQGALVTVASIASDLPSPMLGAYTASKHAVKGFVESLRIELMAEDAPVTVTLVKPAGIDTPIGQHAANHRGHEALVPPPVYDPGIVADTLIDVAQHPRREITVGGAGRANVLIGAHFPGLMERLARFMIPKLTDPSRPPTPENSLERPSNDGRVHSGVEQPRQFSLYTTAARHRMATSIGLAGVAGLGVALLALGGSSRRTR